MNRFALVVGILFTLLGIVKLGNVLAYPLTVVGLVLIVLSFHS